MSEYEAIGRFITVDGWTSPTQVQPAWVPATIAVSIHKNDPYRSQA